MAIKVFVDSGSSIKQEEKEKYNVEIIPLKILLDGVKCGKVNTTEAIFDKTVKEDPSEEVTFDPRLE